MKKKVKISISVLTICSMLAAAFTFITGASTAEATTQAPVTVYANDAFCGTSQDFEVGSHNMEELTVPEGVGNDAIDSIRVAPGYQVTLYKDRDYSGTAEAVTTNKRNISLANNVSSLKIEAIPAHLPVLLYADAEWSGASKEFGPGDYDWDDLGIGNDKLSSLRIAPGYQVTLYWDAGYGGSSIVLTQDIVNLKSVNFNDKTSSFKVQAVSPLDSTCVAVGSFDDASMISIMQQFAPRIWMAQGETYWASSVEWAADYMERYYDTATGKYCLRTRQTLSNPTDKLPFFAGSQASASCYAFWTEKDFNNIDISYWQYCPYNYGKVVLGMEFGDHVGDWEHITVRLAKFTYEGVTYVKPTMVAFPYHSSISLYQWNEVSKVTGTNHVIVYSAKESHGMWKDPGNHVYQDIVIAQLTDVCSAGTAMDCWTILNPYVFSPASLTGRGLGTAQWPSYFDVDYDNPDSGSVFRWGNPGQGSAFGQAILSDGPAGPEGHGTLYDGIILR
jgi:hypothetical protein